MRIIKPGDLKLIEVEKTCYNCKCEFAYNQNDIRGDRDGKFVKCPQCKKLIDIR